MPPRYAYWTILIDGKATAFRAREREELLPTFNQLARKNADIVMRYFARGRLWDNPEQAQWANRNPEVTRKESRDRAWRPGGLHKDPRARFEKKTDRADRPFESKNRKPFDSKFRKPFTATERKPLQSTDRRPAQSSERKPFPSTERKPFQPAEGKPFASTDRKPFKSTDRKPRFDKRGDQPAGRGAFDTKDRGAFGKRPDRPKWQTKTEDRPFDSKDRREPRFDARGGKRTGTWSRPPKRKPR
jgi:hypothetical protein